MGPLQSLSAGIGIPNEIRGAGQLLQILPRQGGRPVRLGQGRVHLRPGKPPSGAAPPHQLAAFSHAHFPTTVPLGWADRSHIGSELLGVHE